MNNEKQKLFTPISPDVAQIPMEWSTQMWQQSIINQNACTVALSNLGQELQRNNQLMLQNVEAIVDKYERRTRNRKAKREGVKLNASPGDVLKIVYEMDNGQQETYVLINNLSGTFTVYNLNLGGFEEADLFLIAFHNEQKFIFGVKKRVRGMYLYDCFQKAGAAFNVRIPVPNASRALMEFFAPLIEKTPNEFGVNPLAGWNGMYFQNAENFAFRKTSEFPKLPVFEKHFQYSIAETENFKNYFTALNCVAEKEDRMLLGIVPFVGILSSLLRLNSHTKNISINFVKLTDVDVNPIMNLIQIYNRSDLKMISLDLSSCVLEKLLLSTNDDVFIVNMECNSNISNYQNNKIKKNVLHAIDVFDGKVAVGDGIRRAGYALPVVFSNEKILRSSCINILISESFWRKTHVAEDDAEICNYENQRSLDDVAMVLCSFVRFVENNYHAILQMIKKNRLETDGRKLLFDIVQEIMETFLISAGFSFSDALKLPNDFRIADVLDKQIESENVLKQFLSAVHLHISKFQIVRKDKAEQYRVQAVYFDEKLMYFPAKLFDKILALDGLLPYKNEILSELKNVGVLHVGPDRVARKTVIAGAHVDTYQVEIGFFNQMGEIDITKLGKEHMSYER